MNKENAGALVMIQGSFTNFRTENSYRGACGKK